jgi:hypothetical protein
MVFGLLPILTVGLLPMAPDRAVRGARLWTLRRDSWRLSHPLMMMLQYAATSERTTPLNVNALA